MNHPEDFAEGADELAFGDFRVDLVRRRLVDARGEAVELSPRLFDALLYFIEHRGELLDKDRLLAALWPGQVVEENNLNKAVSALRRALGDDGDEKRYLLTVPRRGFRFIAEVRRVARVARVAVAPGDSRSLNDEPAAAAATAAAVSARLPATGGSARLSRRHVAAAAAALAACAVGLWAWQRKQRSTDAPVALAVLPFRPLAPNGRDEVLEMGMADSLIARLSVAPGVVVRGIESVQRYANRSTDAVQAARELDAAWVLEGTIQAAGERIRVTARLLHAGDGTAAWSGNFDERFTDVFDVQDTISRRLTEVLVPHLAERVPARAGGGTRNPDAYRLYLQARYHAQLFTSEAFRSGVSLYEQAIAADPTYAYAYAGLADLHRRLVFTSDGEPAVVFKAARAAATRAVELDAHYGDAHAQLGWVAYWHDWDWPHAERTMRHAAALNPSCVDAHYGLAHVLMTTGRGAESLQAFSRAREADPQSLLANTLEGGMLAMLGRSDEGLQRVGSALTINPRFWIGHLMRGSILFNLGRIEPGLLSLRQAALLGGGSAWASAPLAHALAQSGHVDEARAMLEQMLARARVRYFSPTNLALVHAGLGQTAAALHALERAYALRDARLAFLQVDHRFAPLRGEPRFAALVAKMRLDPRAPGWKSTF
jgi:DNA-binding winged helix-turn-helix (wHTH) protein/TolB-like protein/Flp pilus assembly protein TadD